jgi:hypothetical protein
VLTVPFYTLSNRCQIHTPPHMRWQDSRLLCHKKSKIIYRLRVIHGGGRRMTLSLNGERFAYLQNERHWALKLPPGEHVISDKNPED